MSLTLTGGQPTFAELADNAFDAGSVQTATPQNEFQILNEDSKFGVVRNEQFWGYYQNGQMVALPVSPADGYEYSREELFYEPSLYYSGTPGTFAAGTQTKPVVAGVSAPGELLQTSLNVDPSTGLVTFQTSYWNGSNQTVTADGVAMVMVHAQRSR